MMERVLRIDTDDDVLVALEDLRAGEEVVFDGSAIRLAQDVRAKHKVAIRSLPPGAFVRMYGVVVGQVVEGIQSGGLLTTQNLRHEASPFEVRSSNFAWTPPDVTAWQNRAFSGYRRADGRVGTANYWLVIPLVFCENRNVEALRHALADALGYERRGAYVRHVRDLVAMYEAGADAEALRNASLSDDPVEEVPNPILPNVDGVKFLTHGGGCGGTRDDARSLCALLAAYIDHPNVAGATVLSLGCQNAQVALLEEELGRRNPGFQKTLVVVEQQRSGTEARLMREAIAGTFAGLVEANEARRTPATLGDLVFGVECGGSDGFSGISANPAIGHASDLLVALGGSVILSEFPELCGVEQEFIDRSVSLDVAQRFASLQRAYAARAAAVGASFDMNPSAGNVRDGLLTDAMKSAGAARKGGSSPVVDVLDYTESIRRKGLSLLCTPGNDVESTTGLAAAGATIILFSTGMGTPTGNPIVPVVKISSNTPLSVHMPDVVDVDAGTVVTGVETIEETGRRVLEYAVRVAGGEAATAAARLSQDDFLPWKRDISL